MPSDAIIHLLADALGVSVQWLQGEPEYKSEIGLDEKANLQEITQQEAREWKKRALVAEEKMQRLENILKELFAFAKIGG